MLFISFMLQLSNTPYRVVSIVSFVNLSNKNLDFLKYHVPQRLLTDYFKTANTLFLPHVL